MGADQTSDRVYKCVYKVPVVFWQSQLCFFENPYRAAVFFDFCEMNRVRLRDKKPNMGLTLEV
jgi:hypothetical protein